MAKKIRYLLLLFYITICSLFLLVIYNSIKVDVNVSYNDFELDSFGSKDAKFAYDGYIVTSHNDRLCLINTKTQEIKESRSLSSWVGAIANNNAVVYTDKYYLTRSGRIDSDTSTLSGNFDVLDSKIATIDPTITRFNGKYYLCITQINGNINVEKDEEYGLYSIELYRSTNLQNWEFQDRIFSQFRNLEDVKFSKNSGMEIIFEEEDFDKGSSKILFCSSNDSGVTWNDPITVIDNSADNEPAALILLNDNYYVFYSSDINRIGESYSSAKCYYNRYDLSFNLLETKEINLKFPEGILLYDVEIYEDKIYFLYSHDYQNKNDLCLETKSLEEIGI